MDDELLTPEDVERQYKLKRATQASMRSRRQIPFVKLGGRIPRYRRSDLEQWLTERAVPLGVPSPPSPVCGETMPSETRQGNDTAARGLRASLCARLEACSHDELRVLDRLLARLELGRDRYGALDLSKDDRDWDEEAAEEREDGLIYEAMRDTARRARLVEAIAKLDIPAPGGEEPG